MTEQATRERRRESAKQRRFEKRWATVRNLTASICEVWMQARQEGWTHERMLTWRNEHVLTRENYRALPWRDQTQLAGVWDACQYLAYRDGWLVYCYPHPDTGEVWESERICNEGLAGRVALGGEESRGGYYWRNADGTYSHKWS